MSTACDDAGRLVELRWPTLEGGPGLGRVGAGAREGPAVGGAGPVEGPAVGGG